MLCHCWLMTIQNVAACVVPFRTWVRDDNDAAGRTAGSSRIRIHVAAHSLDGVQWRWRSCVQMSRKTSAPDIPVYLIACAHALIRCINYKSLVNL
jgi:hypothetical protein